MTLINTIMREAETRWRHNIEQYFPQLNDLRFRYEQGDEFSAYTILEDREIIITLNQQHVDKVGDDIARVCVGNKSDHVINYVHFVLLHETYHYFEGSRDYDGPQSDEKKIIAAIRKGILQRKPSLTPSEQIMKIQSSKDYIDDFLVNTRICYDNMQRDYLPYNIMPCIHADTPSFQSMNLTNQFIDFSYLIVNSIPRFLFGNTASMAIHIESMKDKEEFVSLGILGILVGYEIPLSKIYSKDKGVDQTFQRKILTDVWNQLDGKNRYTCIENMMALLGGMVMPHPKSTPPLSAISSAIWDDLEREGNLETFMRDPVMIEYQRDMLKLLRANGQEEVIKTSGLEDFLEEYNREKV